MVLWGFSNNTGENILNSLEAVYLGDVYVEEERIAVVYSVLDQTIQGFILDRLLPDRIVHGVKAAQAIHSFIADIYIALLQVGLLRSASSPSGVK